MAGPGPEEPGLRRRAGAQPRAEGLGLLAAQGTA